MDVFSSFKVVCILSDCGAKFQAFTLSLMNVFLLMLVRALDWISLFILKLFEAHDPTLK